MLSVVMTKMMKVCIEQTGPPRECLGPRVKGNLAPPPPILQIMILKLSPLRGVISKESVQQK